jgi:hypothetical protein
MTTNSGISKAMPLRQVVPGLLVGVQDQLVEIVVEVERDEEPDDQHEGRPDDPGAKLTQVVGQRHPAVGTHGVLSAPPEEPRKALDQGTNSVVV